MKFLIVFVACLVAVSAQEAADPHGINAVHSKCQSNPETQVDETIFEKLEKHEKVELPENFKKHVLCMVKGLHLLNEEGKVNPEGVKTHVKHVITDEQEVEKITNKCCVDEETPEKTAGKMWKCLEDAHVIHGLHDNHHHHAHHHSGESSESGSSESHEHGHKHH